MKNYKIYKTIDKRIELLEERGLKVINKAKLKWYLTSYNYQNLINGYNDFFMVNESRNTNKYKYESNSEGIIDLFNFDRQISQIILSSIQNIERKLSTAIAYVISKKMYENGNDNGQLFCLNYNDIIIKKIFSTDEKLWKEIKNHILKNIDMKEPLFNKFKSKRKFLYEV